MGDPLGAGELLTVAAVFRSVQAQRNTLAGVWVLTLFVGTAFCVWLLGWREVPVETLGHWWPMLMVWVFGLAIWGTALSREMRDLIRAQTLIDATLRGPVQGVTP
jgi:hypothetical protein